MSRIKVYVRMRPPLPGEFDVPGCFNCCELEEGAGNWIKVKKEGEPVRHFSRVFGPKATQDEIYRSVGINTVNDVLEGYNGCIFVYGQTGTGKTFTLGCLTPRLEGIQPRCLQHIFERKARDRERFETSVRLQYVQIYRDNVQDLWNIEHNDLPIRVDDEAGATIEGVTTLEAGSYEEAIKAVTDGDENRSTANTRMNSASSRSHACLIVEVTRRDRSTNQRTLGRLYLIDLAGSERVSKSGATGDTYKEAVAINQSLTTLGNCISGLVNGEKVVAFRDSKLTRLLQHSLTGHGRTSIVVTIRPDSINMQETLWTLKFGERAQKVETQMTPATYCEKTAEMRIAALEQLRSLADHQNALRLAESDASSARSVYNRRDLEVRGVEAMTNAELAEINQAFENEKHEMNQEYARFELEASTAHKAAAALLTEQNADVIRDLEKRVNAGVHRETKDIVRTEKLMEQKLSMARKDAEVLSRKVDKTELDDTSVDEKVQIRMWHVREELEEAKRRLRGCRRSANEALDEAQLRAVFIVRQQQLKALQRKRDMLVSRAWHWDRELMLRSVPQPSHAVLHTYAEEVFEEMRDYASSATSAPTTPTLSSTASGTLRSSAQSAARGSSTTPPSTHPSMATSDSFLHIGDESSEYEEIEEYEEVVIARVNFDKAVEEEEDLHRTKEKLVKYLQKGTVVYNVVPPMSAYEQRVRWMEDNGVGEAAGTSGKKGSGGSSAKKKAKGEPTFEDLPTLIRRNRMVLDGNVIVLTPIDKHGDPIEKFEKVIPLNMIHDVVLGQYTRTFQRALEGTNLVPHGAVMPHDSSRISIPGLRLFFYRSLSLVGDGLGGCIDLVANSDADFEAWTVGLLFAARIDPRWGGPLEIHHAHPLLHEMTEAEVNCCIQHHILPENFVAFRNALIAKEPPVLFLTPIFIRSFAKVDLLHAFKLLSFLTAVGEVEVCRVNQVRYLEMVNAEQEFQAERRRIRDLRQRIVNMLRKYRPCNAATTERYLRNITGFEEEVLDELVERYGPEPDEDDLIEPVVEVQEKDGSATATGSESDGLAPNEDMLARRNVRESIEESEAVWFEHFFNDRHKEAVAKARQRQIKRLPAQFPYDTIAGRLENIRHSLLCNDKLQEQFSYFVEPHVVPEPHLLRHEHLYLPALDIIDQFVSGENVSPVAGGSQVTSALASALSCALKSKITDNVMLILGLEGSGKTLLAQFLFQHYLTKIDLGKSAAMVDPHVAMNEVGRLAPSFSKASQASRRAQAIHHFANRAPKWIPIFIDVASIQKPETMLIAEGLSKFFGIDYVALVEEQNASKKSKKKGEAKDGGGNDATGDHGSPHAPPLQLDERQPAVVAMAREGPLSWANLQRNAPLLFIIDGIDAMAHSYAKGPAKESLAVEDRLVSMAAHFSAEMDYEEVVGLEDAKLLTKESKCRLFATNKLQQWYKSKFIFTCRHVPQANSDWKNTHFLSFVKRFVAPSNTKKPLLPDLTSLSTVCLAPFNEEKQTQLFFRYVDMNAAAMKTFGRGFDGAYRLADELKRMRNWFYYCRTPGLLMPIVEVLSMVRRERKAATAAAVTSGSSAASPQRAARASVASLSPPVGGGGGAAGDDTAEEGLTLFSAFERFIELHSSSRIERLGLDAVPIPLRTKDVKQAMKLFCYEAALAMAKRHVYVTILNSVLDRSSGVDAKRSLGLVQQDPTGLYFRQIGPFQMSPMWSSAPLANPPTVLGTSTAPWLVFSDELCFANRMFQDFFVACVIVRQLLADPRDVDNVANQYSFSKSEVLMTFVFDQLGQERLLEILAIVKTVSGGKHKNFPLAVLGSNVVSTLVFHNVSFAQFDFEGISLVASNLRYGQLDYADLRGCDLTAAVMSHSQLNHANIAGSCWREAVLKDWAPIVERDMLMTCAFSPNGKIAVVAGFEGVVSVFDAPTARPVLRMVGHEGCVTGVAISRDGRLVVSGAEDMLVRIWEGATGDCLFELEGHEDGITGVAISHDGQFVASSSDDGTVRIWRTETGEEVHVLEGHSGVCWCVTYFDESRKLLSGGDDGEVMAWDAETGEHLMVILTPGKDTVRTVKMSPAGNVIAAAGDECVVYLFDVGGDLIHKLEGHLGSIWSVDFSPFGGLLASGGADRSVRIWDVAHAVELSCNYWHTHELRCVCFNEEGTLLLTASCDKTCRTHAVFLDTASIVGPEMEAPSPVHSLQLLDDVKIVIGAQGSVSVFEIESLHCLFRHVPSARVAITAGFAPPLQLEDAPFQFYFGSVDGVLRVAEQNHVDTSGTSLIAMLSDHTSAVTALDASPNGEIIVSGSGDCQLKLWRVTEDEDPFAQTDRTHTFAALIRTIKGHKAPITRVRIAKSGKFVLSASADKTIRLTSLRDGRVKKIFAGHKAVVNDIQISTDEQMLVSASADRTIRVWELRTAEEIMCLRGHQGSVTCIALNSTCRTIFSGSLDRTVRVWSMLAGTEDAVLPTHQVSAIAVSSDDRMICTGGFDGTVRVMLRLEMRWCIMRQIGPRGNVEMDCQRLVGYDDADGLAKAAKYFLEGLARQGLEEPDGEAAGQGGEPDQEGDTHNHAA